MPHICGMKKTTAYLGEHETALLKQASELEGVSQGAIITRALRTYFRARARKARSVGSGRSGRRDLSEAERHRAFAIVTLDVRHFRAVSLKINPPPRLIPLDS